MKIVVLDAYVINPGDLSWEPLRQMGELTVYDRTPVEDEREICRRIGEAEVVITNKTPVTRSVLNACPNIKLITLLSTGYNVVDVQAARERDIPVCNVPGYGTAAVGQFAIALLLEICHHVGQHSESVHAGHWSSSTDWCYWDTPQIELAGKTMGIIGFGRIGRTTGAIAAAMGMRVIATGSRPTPEGKQIARYVDLDTLLAQSDVISLHCPLFPETRGIINRDTIARMKDGVILINNSRGPLIVEQDLADALNCGKVAAAGLDVVSTEPIRPENPLLKAKNCLITPHISWAAQERRERILETTRENLCAWLSGHPIHVVN